MKYVILTIVTFVWLTAMAQDDWRDSLDLARKAYQNKEYVKALDYYQSAQKKAPEHIDLSDEMAQSAYKAREFERAEKIYQQQRNTKTSDAQKADNFHNLGNARMKQQNYQGAIDAYKEALRILPNDERTRYNLSEAIRQLNMEQSSQNKKSEEKNNEEQQQQQQSNGSSSNQQKQQDSSKGKGDQRQDQSKLSNQMVERELDKLSKKEAETKRKVSGSSSAGRSAKSGKDW